VARPLILLLICTALFFLPLYSEEPAAQIRRVNQLSAEELFAVRERALQGDPDAQVTLGVAYDGGNRVFKRDTAEARHWYEKSAKQGNLDAQFWLLELDYSDGKDVRSRSLALSRAGHMGAVNLYANLCAKGTDGPRSYAEAML
jgi:TPR repeat protein